jgi:hypothetical protein
MTTGLEFEVTAISTSIDSQFKHLKDGEPTAPWPIETITLRTPFDDAFCDRFRVANMDGAYFVGDDGTFSIRIVDPEMQGKLKIGDRIDLLKALIAKQ